MCGFVGILDTAGHAERFADALKAASAAIAHRGPDDDGKWFDGAVGLGFRRLAILDLTPAGHQPMVSADGDWAVVFNGEIYNYVELAKELTEHGVRFRSTSDTEVLVEALARWGPRCFSRFNGMWAVLAWHRPSRTLHACRDPWGIKPLYVCDEPDRTCFASEIKALEKMGCNRGGVDAISARRFLDTGELDTDTRTMFSRVRRLEPGVLYRYRVGQPVESWRYPDGTGLVDMPTFRNDDRGLADFTDAFRDAFLQAVRIRLRADVDVGTCLSGGLDSTAIVCAAGRFLNRTGGRTCRHAFTALLPEFDESRYIRPVIEQTGAEWHITVASDVSVLEHLPGFFRTHDEPVHSLSALAGYLVMGLAADANVKVMLNGQGGDEALAGYPSTVLPHLRTVLVQDGLAYGMREAVAEAGNTLGGLGLVARAEAGLLSRALPDTIDGFLRRLPMQLSGNGLVNGTVALSGPLGERPRQPRPPTGSLQPALHDQMVRSPLPLYLRIEDANSSSFSLESRLPFLDPTVIAMARAAPASMLRRGGLNKYLLRRILPGLVPDVVWQRQDKMGFPVPHARWFHGPLREALTETMAADRLHRRGWYNVKTVTRKVESFLADPTAPFPTELLRLFLMERWAREHLDR